ncbi:MAG TPA: RluA family pseudouridine synthase [Deltaproteobacteria bacterium]|nr:RluA family pseudouridine synthase [Deltaproteobacteria bacterium]
METANSNDEYSFVVSNEQSGQRLDLFLSRVIPDLSRSHFKKLIKEDLILVNGNPVKPSYETRAGDLIMAKVPGQKPDEVLKPEPMCLDILFEDEDLLIVNKAPSLVVHPGAGHSEGTLVHGLLAHCARLAVQGSPLRPGIVHRLDKDTSGALVIAKSERAYLNLVRQFKERGVRKEYLALVYGSPAKGEGEISSLLGRDPIHRKKIAVLQHGGREALSRWRVEKHWGETALLRVQIETGRTHQIRVHLSHIGHPVVGDETYGGDRRRARNVKSAPVRDLLLGTQRQMLHAIRLEFTHPVTGATVTANAPMPEDFRDLIERLDCLSQSE